MKFSLAAMVRRARPGMRRRAIVFREIAPPAVLATDLFQACYRPVLAAWERRAPRIVAEYERSLSEITTDSATDLGALFDDIAAELQRLVLDLTPRLRDWTVRVEGWVRGRWRGAVLSATGVDLQTLIGPEDARLTLETAIERNVALIRDVSDQARGRIADAVYRGLSQRKPAREVAGEIREAIAMGRRRSIRIASHQLSSISAGLAAERRREAGLSVFKWRHSGKLHARPWHKERDGKLYSETSADVGRMADGQTVNEAPPEDDRAGVPPFCGCREQSVLVFEWG